MMLFFYYRNGIIYCFWILPLNLPVFALPIWLGKGTVNLQKQGKLILNLIPAFRVLIYLKNYSSF